MMVLVLRRRARRRGRASGFDITATNGFAFHARAQTPKAVLGHLQRALVTVLRSTASRLRLLGTNCKGVRLQGRPIASQEIRQFSAPRAHPRWRRRVNGNIHVSVRDIANNVIVWHRGVRP